MSRLAAVTTGQPTQGMGTVPAARPAAKSVSARQFASPLEAQRAEAEAAGVLPGDDFATPALAPVPLSSRDPYSAARAVTTAAWLTLDAKEIEVRRYFHRIAVASGHELLAKMRKQCDLAAETLQQRIDEWNTERCTGCGKTLEQVHKTQWIMTGSEVDPDTGVPMPYRYCGVQCVRARNREKMLPPEERNKKRFDGQEEGDIR